MPTELKDYLATKNLVEGHEEEYDLIGRDPTTGQLVRLLYAAQPEWALEFTAANVSHVNHGLLWQPGTEYKEFWADALLKPTETGYIPGSAGYGGGHCLLWGISGNLTDGFTISGNVYDSDTATLTSFSTVEKMRANKWCYTSLAYDGTRIVVYINGVPSSIIPYTGIRKTAAAVDGTWLVGGSNHNMGGGRLGGIRIFESDPSVFFSGGSAIHEFAFKPAVANFAAAAVRGSAGMVEADFLADYRTGTLKDYSNGLDGNLHHGYFAEANTDIVGLGGGLYDPVGYNIDPTKYPAWVIDPFSFPTDAAPQRTQIASSRIYDDFSRTDVHFGLTPTLGLGTTRVGGEVWDSTNYGILNGSAYVARTSGGEALITDNTADGTTIFRRPFANTYLSGSAIYTLWIRYTDANNYTKLQIDNLGQWGVYEIIAGSGSWITSGGYGAGWGTTWTEAKAIASGTSIQIHKDGVLLETVTSAFTTGLKKGFGLNQPVLRVSEFAVI